MARHTPVPLPVQTIPDLPFANPDRPHFDIETFTLDDLRRRVPEALLRAPQRMAFHVLILCRAGQGVHIIDFQRYAWRPGAVLHVRPGQVHQFALTAGMRAQLVLFTRGFVASGESELASRYARLGSVPRVVPAPGDRRIAAVFETIAKEYRSGAGSAISRAILRHQLHILLLLLCRMSDVADSFATPDAMHEIYYRFRDMVDMHHAHNRRVSEYARSLGCSAKTLGRACLSAAGATPKQLIKDRIALEAQRFLAHTHAPVKRIAHELGFSEETNFVKFFRHTTGQSPSAFRAKSRA